MAGPPNDVEPSELWRRLNETPKPSEVIDFPRKDANGKPLSRVRIQVLSMMEHDEARIKAHQWLKDKHISPEEFGGPTIREVYGDAVARELLAMACVAEEPVKGTEDNPRYARLFRSGKDMEALTADELTVLFTAYEMAQRKFGPFEGNLNSEQEISDWVKRLAEGASSFPLAQLSWHRLVELTTSLARRAYCLSACLDSQCSNLPDTMKSALEPWDIGTGYYGLLRAALIAPGLNLLSEEELEARGEELDELTTEAEIEAHRLHKAMTMDPLDIAAPDETITTEQAAEFAQIIHKNFPNSQD